LLLADKLNPEVDGMNDATEKIYKAELDTAARADAGRMLLADKLNPEVDGMNDATEKIYKAELDTAARADAGRMLLADKLNPEVDGMNDATEKIYKAELDTAARADAGRMLLQSNGNLDKSDIFLQNQLKLSESTSAVATAMSKISSDVRMRLNNSKNKPA
jgi:hypothetical protein